MIQKAFPSYLQKDADKIADFLQQNDPKDFKTIGAETICLNRGGLQRNRCSQYSEKTETADYQVFGRGRRRESSRRGSETI